MADAKELKPCPCGKTPDRLGISDGGQGGKYHFVAGDCCSEWMIEFRANYKPLESDECMALAIAAWNASPRAATPPADAAMDNVHSCSYFCIRQPCINRQRDELREKYFAALDDIEYHKQAAANAQLNALRRSIENGTEQ